MFIEVYISGFKQRSKNQFRYLYSKLSVTEKVKKQTRDSEVNKAIPGAGSNSHFQEGETKGGDGVSSAHGPGSLDGSWKESRSW